MFSETIVPAARIVWPEGHGPGVPRTLTLDAGAGEGLGSSVVLDFGEEFFGGVRLEVVGAGPEGSCRVRVRLGESVSEAIAGTYVDRRAEVRAGSKLEVGVTGFRFARLDVEDAGGWVEFAIPLAYGRERDVPRVGSFATDDPRLDRAWEVGARTAHLCAQDLIWDGIKRGRTVWAGDIHPAWNALAAAYGPQPVVAASLDQLRGRTAGDGGEVRDWMNDIPAYSLWWVICQAEWHLYTGDRAYLDRQAGYLSGLLGLILAGIGPDGREAFEGWRYLDWATTRDVDAIAAGYHGLTAWALRSAAWLFGILGDPANAARCAGGLARSESGPPPATASKQARALLVLGGLADAVATNREVLSVDPAAGLTPFLGYHVLEARAMAGDHAGAHALIRDYWGAMIDRGATTFWEDFDVDWLAGSGRIDAVVPEGARDIHAGIGRNARRGLGLSLCHAWSAGPTAWLSRHVLGVRPVEPGCRAVRVEPHLGDLTRAEGTFPTPLGPIAVRHRRRGDGTIETEVDAPDGVEVVPNG